MVPFQMGRTLESHMPRNEPDEAGAGAAVAIEAAGPEELDDDLLRGIRDA